MTKRSRLSQLYSGCILLPRLVSSAMHKAGARARDQEKMEGDNSQKETVEPKLRQRSITQPMENRNV